MLIYVLSFEALKPGTTKHKKSKIFPPFSTFVVDIKQHIGEVSSFKQCQKLIFFLRYKFDKEDPCGYLEPNANELDKGKSTINFRACVSVAL